MTQLHLEFRHIVIYQKHIDKNAHSLAACPHKPHKPVQACL
jgi:hypothetical protein